MSCSVATRMRAVDRELAALVAAAAPGRGSQMHAHAVELRRAIRRAASACSWSRTSTRDLADRALAADVTVSTSPIRPSPSAIAAHTAAAARAVRLLDPVDVVDGHPGAQPTRGYAGAGGGLGLAVRARSRSARRPPGRSARVCRRKRQVKSGQIVVLRPLRVEVPARAAAGVPHGAAHACAGGPSL